MDSQSEPAQTTMSAPGGTGPPEGARVATPEEVKKSKKGDLGGGQTKWFCLLCRCVVDARRQSWDSHCRSVLHNHNLRNETVGGHTAATSQMREQAELTLTSTAEHQSSTVTTRSQYRLRGSGNDEHRNQEQEQAGVATRSRSANSYSATDAVPQEVPQPQSLLFSGNGHDLQTEKALVDQASAFTTSGFTTDEYSDDEYEDGSVHEERNGVPVEVTNEEGGALSEAWLRELDKQQAKVVSPAEGTTTTAPTTEITLPTDEVEKMRLSSKAREVPPDFMLPRFDLTPSQVAYIKLTEILDKHGAPLNMHDDINQWAADIVTECGIQHGSSEREKTLKGQRTMVDWVQRTYPSPGALAETVQLEMIPSLAHMPQTATVNYWVFEHQLQDLMLDSDLFGDPKNVVCSAENSFHPPARPQPGVQIDEAMEGKWFHDTIELYKKKYDFDPDLDIIVPIILALDKTSVTWNSRYGLEPIVFTVANLRRWLRNKPEAWRHLALIPDIEENSKQQKKQSDSTKKTHSELGLSLPGRNLRNYHKCTAEALKSFVAFQRRTLVRRAEYDPANNLNVRFGNQVSKRRTLCPVMFCIVDGACADDLTCRYGHYGTYNDRRLATHYPRSTQAMEMKKKEQEEAAKEAKKKKAGVAGNKKHAENSANTQGRKKAPTQAGALEDLDEIVNNIDNSKQLRGKKEACRYLHGRICRGCTCRPDEAALLSDNPQDMDDICSPLKQKNMIELTASAFNVVDEENKAREEKRRQLELLANNDDEDDEIRIKKVINDLNACLQRLDDSVVEMARLSHHFVDNAYHQLEYGSNEGGIYTATPTDVMHAFLEGILKYVVELFFASIGPTRRAIVDRFVNTYFGNTVPSQSGTKKYPRTCFRGGISKTTMMAAHEFQGIALVLSLALRDPDLTDLLRRPIKGGGKKPMEPVTGQFVGESDPYHQYSVMFSYILSFLRWTREGPFYADKEKAEASRIGVNRFLYWLEKFFPRDEKSGWRLPKLHDCTHLWNYIQLFGSPMNFDNGAAERNHKQLAKLHGRRAQEHGDDTYRRGTSRRIEETSSLQKARRHMKAQLDSIQRKAPDRTSTEFSKKPYSVVLLFAGTGEIGYRAKVVKLGKTKSLFTIYDNASVVPPTVVRPEVLMTILQQMDERTVSSEANPSMVACFLYAQCTIEGGKNEAVIFRSHPNYLGLGPWHDWCWTDWKYGKHQVPFDDDTARRNNLITRGEKTKMGFG